jgi:hypothetical protein
VANLAVLSDLAVYGLDICLIANILGDNAYVIDFNLYYEITGNTGECFLNIPR